MSKKEVYRMSGTGQNQLEKNAIRQFVKEKIRKLIMRERNQKNFLEIETGWNGNMEKNGYYQRKSRYTIWPD